jgi:hypothetical protein
VGYSTYEKELLAIVLAVQHWKCYLLGVRFIILTDQESIKYFAEQKLTTILQQRWSAKLLGFEFEIRYRRGKENLAADALSRRFAEGEISTITITQPKWHNDVLASYIGDDEMQTLIKKLEVDPNSVSHYHLIGPLVRYKDRIAVGNSKEHKLKLIEMVHASADGGHSGNLGTYRKLKNYFFWKGLKSDVQAWVSECDCCQRNKHENVSPPGLLQPLPIPEQAWRHVTMDFITGLPKSEGKDVIMVVVDRFTKYSHFVALNHPYTAKVVAKEFMNSICKLHGIPESIISDRDPIFLSAFWKELFELLGTDLKLTTAYHPQTDGQSERVNACLETFLRCMTGQKPNCWNSWLSLAEWWFNVHHHSRLGMTPFKALYGYDPPLLGYHKEQPCKVAAVEEYLGERRLMDSIIKETLEAASARTKVMADKRRSERVFEVGDYVYLKLQPYRQTSVAVRHNFKLSARYYGPYEVIQRIGEVAYKLKLPETTRIHPVFHVSQLKKKIGHAKVAVQELPYADQHGQLRVKPAKILDRRMVKRQNKAVAQVLIQWFNAAPDDATWEDYDFVKDQFPSFCL